MTDRIDRFLNHKWADQFLVEFSPGDWVFQAREDIQLSTRDIDAIYARLIELNGTEDLDED